MRLIHWVWFKVRCNKPSNEEGRLYFVSRWNKPSIQTESYAFLRSRNARNSLELQSKACWRTNNCSIVPLLRFLQLYLPKPSKISLWGKKKGRGWTKKSSFFQDVNIVLKKCLGKRWLILLEVSEWMSPPSWWTAWIKLLHSFAFVFHDLI